MKNEPIGIFDSGIGGLTVAHAVAHLLPNEDFIYLGDIARVPYGTRGKAVITSFALEMAAFLLQQHVKCLVIACNTISAICLDQIKSLSRVPVLGVIAPSVTTIIHTTKNNKVGIIGTRATIASNAYRDALHKQAPQIEVFSVACPLFVPLAEEGLAKSTLAKLAANMYLSNLTYADIDTLHLGCTHYPLLKDAIQKTIGDKITIIDSAEPTATALQQLLQDKGLLNNTASPKYEFYFTDASETTLETAKLFFGRDIKISLAKFNTVIQSK